MHNMQQTDEWNAEHGRSRIYSQEETARQSTYFKMTHMQANFIMLMCWIGWRKEGSDKLSDWEVLLHHIRDYNLNEYSVPLKNSDLRFKAGAH